MAGVHAGNHGKSGTSGDEEFWATYRQKSPERAREELVLKYLPLVGYIAGRVAINLPLNIEYDDLVEYGIIGLLDAASKFEVSRGVKFETYAQIRIRGAIMDGIRNLDWVPRSIRAKAKKLEQTYTSLEQELGRPATNEEVAKALGIDRAFLDSMVADINRGGIVSLDELLQADEDGGTVAIVDVMRDPDSPDPIRVIEKAELVRRLGQAIDELPDKEKLVISLYYYEELTVREIAKVLGVSESRVSQLHTQAILRLHGKLTSEGLIEA
ncbi:MAG: FliA/WhiG family RNA polymerase sigma factor [Firmicutes bacterium]|nr:FliA/WhiG family RNA polymerase sigma factor [Bacillota bacterium]